MRVILRMFGMFAVAAIGAAAALAQQDAGKPVGGSFKLLSGAAVHNIMPLEFGDITRPTGDGGGQLLMTCNIAGEAAVTVPDTAKNPDPDDDKCGSFKVRRSSASSFGAASRVRIYFNSAGSEPFRNGETVLETMFSLFANGIKTGDSFNPASSDKTRQQVALVATQPVINFSVGASAEISSDTSPGLYTASFEIVVAGFAPPLSFLN